MNQEGSITEEITLMMLHKGHKEKAVFEICDLGTATLIVGHPWLRKHNPEINWQTGKVKLTRCPSECSVFIRAAKQNHKKGTYRVTMEEVDDEDMEVHVRAGIIEDADTILEEIVEEHFIRKADTERMPELCQDNEDDENEDDDKILVFQIEKGKSVHYIVSTSKPVSWGNKDLNPQAKDGKVRTPEEIVLKRFYKYMKVFRRKHQKGCQQENRGIMLSR